MDSCSYFKLIGCFILISIATAQETQATSCPPRDCQEVYERGNTCSGVYTVKPDHLPAFEVYCDMSNGGGWSVFQRRMDGSVDFYRNWTDYVKGFGDLNGEFWLGLHKLSRLTDANNLNLRVDLEDFDGNKKYATYHFRVFDASFEYKLLAFAYGGDAGDGLSIHNGLRFSTKDRDNDIWATGSCATTYGGAWWYKDCYTSNLNGLYLIGYNSTEKGVNWLKFPTKYYSLKTSEMKVNQYTPTGE
ncbi:PREDICTED: ficolin-1-like isoform X1 [Amphimedon queenslandica]|uniref:Fibrinogen C-terminal domain-containing protein n=1 Tax=Amphimedon queenslandica TaxID=400682 RepID=A0A1X7TRL5_AMPQE|nr:PREDICTED: ficolin-1-like isoform X1 [Amphimedon queenslandica]|eukprot:XP_003389966.1 PREDICTED: ficolin-1-like isoform X1 [Amphimedon queenslandica]